MHKPLQDKTALVTGASRGIGRAIALRLAADGARMAVHYGSNQAAANETVAAIEQAGGKAFAVQGDLSTLAGVEALAAAFSQELESSGGGFDILVNNAGAAVFGEFDATTEAVFDQQFAINVKAPFFLTQKLLPKMRDGGRIISTSSAVTRATFAPSQLSAYAMTKAAVDTFTLYLAAIAGPRNITVNAVRPGVIETDMAAFVRTPEGAAQALQVQALQRIGQPADIAGIVAFLAGPDGGWTTGQMIDGSGGFRL